MTKRRWAILGVSLALAAVCALAMFTIYLTVGAVRAAGGSWRLGGPGGLRSTQRERASYRVGASPSLTVDTAAGGITVTVGADEVIEVETVKTSWGSADDAAGRAGRSLVVAANQRDDEVTLSFRVPDRWLLLGDGARRDTVSYNIKVPAATRVTLTSAGGPVTLSGTRGAAILSSDFGDVTAADLAGGADLTMSGGAGDLLVRGGELGALTLDGDFGDLTVDQVRARGIAARSGNGKLHVTGSTVLAGTGDCCRLLARNGFGDIVVRGTQAPAYDLETANGVVDVDGAAGPLRLHSGFGDVRVTHARDVVLDLATQNGDVSFEGSLAAGNAGGDRAAAHTATSNFGDVTVALPPESRLGLLLTTDFGVVSSALPVAVAGVSSGTRLAGTLNGGGPRLELSSRNGNVRLQGAARSGS